MLVLYLALQGIMPFEPKFTVHLLPACVPGDALQSSWSSRETAVVAEKA
jgi:hypothetical protein